MRSYIKAAACKACGSFMNTSRKSVSVQLSLFLSFSSAEDSQRSQRDLHIF